MCATGLLGVTARGGVRETLAVWSPPPPSSPGHTYLVAVHIAAQLLKGVLDACRVGNGGRGTYAESVGLQRTIRDPVST